MPQNLGKMMLFSELHSFLVCPRIHHHFFSTVGQKIAVRWELLANQNLTSRFTSQSTWFPFFHILNSSSHDFRVLPS